MKLAEALSLRADATRRVEQLRTRIVANARFQEGEEPTEDAAALLAEAGAVLDELEGLIRRINRTNAVTQIGPDVSTATEYPTSGGRAGRHRWLWRVAGTPAGCSTQAVRSSIRNLLMDLAERATGFRSLIRDPVVHGGVRRGAGRHGDHGGEDRG